jgi:hypothetical protein
MLKRDTTHPTPLTQETLSQYNILIIDHANLDEFITKIGGVSNLPSDLEIYTEDKYTRETVEFNLIVTDNDTSKSEYEIATQLHHPITETDSILDLRNNTNTFADEIQGIATAQQEIQSK